MPNVTNKKDNDPGSVNLRALCYTNRYMNIRIKKLSFHLGKYESEASYLYLKCFMMNPYLCNAAKQKTEADKIIIS